jgi:hypothetical protein
MAFKFNPFTGTLDLVGGEADVSPDNFSYLLVATGSTVTIPTGQQMVFDGQLVVDGVLEVDGTISQLVNYTFWAYSWNKIAQDVALYVPILRDMLVVSGLTIDGVLTIDGRLIEVE